MVLRDTNIRRALRDRQRGFLLNPFRFGGGGGGGGSDPDFANVRFLLHMDGANGSTTFTDSSGTPKTISPFLGAQISTAESRFGGASGLFNSAAYLQCGAAADADIGTSDFCVECFVRPSNVTPLQRIASTRTITSRGWELFLSAGQVAFQIRNNSGVTASAGSTTLLANNVWTHVAFTRVGATNYLFVGGNLEASVPAGASTPDGPLNIGRRPLGSGPTPYGGYIDEFRMTIGSGRYSASFTPPAAPFPDS